MKVVILVDSHRVLQRNAQLKRSEQRDSVSLDRNFKSFTAEQNTVNLS
jgi:hypothetical protein